MEAIKEKEIIRYVSIGIFFVSLTQKTFSTSFDRGIYEFGFSCLTMGWLGVLVGGAAISWLANPFLIISWMILVKNQLWSIILSGISVCLCLSFLFFDGIILDEGGCLHDITGYRIGYWLWTLSSILFFCGNLWIRFKPQNFELGKTETKKDIKRNETPSP